MQAKAIDDSWQQKKWPLGSHLRMISLVYEGHVQEKILPSLERSQKFFEVDTFNFFVCCFLLFLLRNRNPPRNFFSRSKFFSSLFQSYLV